MRAVLTAYVVRGARAEVVDESVAVRAITGGSFLVACRVSCASCWQERARLRKVSAFWQSLSMLSWYNPTNYMATQHGSTARVAWQVVDSDGVRQQPTELGKPPQASVAVLSPLLQAYLPQASPIGLFPTTLREDRQITENPARGRSSEIEGSNAIVGRDLKTSTQ